MIFILNFDLNFDLNIQGVDTAGPKINHALVTVMNLANRAFGKNVF